MNKVIIVGGGAAGMMAAISASKSSFSRPGVGRSNLVMTARNTT